MTKADKLEFPFFYQYAGRKETFPNYPYRRTDSPEEAAIVYKYRKDEKDLFVRTENKQLHAKENQVIEEQCFRIRLAKCSESLGSANMLVQKMYSTRGYPPNPVKFKPMNLTLLAYLNEKPVGTITLGLDSELGLAADQLYKEKIQKLRNEGRRIVEFTKLAIDSNPNSKYILGSMLHIAYIYARLIYNYTDVVLEVVPHHKDFYIRMLDCKPLADERFNTRVNTPVTLLTLDGRHVDKMITLYGGKSETVNKRTLYKYFFSKLDETGIMQRLLRSHY